MAENAQATLYSHMEEMPEARILEVMATKNDVPKVQFLATNMLVKRVSQHLLITKGAVRPRDLD